MPQSMTLLLVPLLMNSCFGFASGGLRTDVPPTIAEECRHPSAYLGAGNWEVLAGRLGDELIDCERKRAAAVEALQGVGDAIR